MESVNVFPEGWEPFATFEEYKKTRRWLDSFDENKRSKLEALFLKYGRDDDVEHHIKTLELMVGDWQREEWQEQMLREVVNKKKAADDVIQACQTIVKNKPFLIELMLKTNLSKPMVAIFFYVLERLCVYCIMRFIEKPEGRPRQMATQRLVSNVLFYLDVVGFGVRGRKSVWAIVTELMGADIIKDPRDYFKNTDPRLILDDKVRFVPLNKCPEFSKECEVIERNIYHLYEKPSCPYQQVLEIALEKVGKGVPK